MTDSSFSNVKIKPTVLIAPWKHKPRRYSKLYVLKYHNSLYTCQLETKGLVSSNFPSRRRH